MREPTCLPRLGASVCGRGPLLLLRGAPPAPLPVGRLRRGVEAVVVRRLRHGGRVGVGGIVAVHLNGDLARSRDLAADAP